jgi:hypothetical protein
MYRFEGRQLIGFGIAIGAIGVAFMITALISGPGWLIAGGAGVVAVGAVQALIGRDHLRDAANPEADPGSNPRP